MLLRNKCQLQYKKSGFWLLNQVASSFLCSLFSFQILWPWMIFLLDHSSFLLIASVYSISDLCSSYSINSSSSDSTFWASLWADKHTGLLRNLFPSGCSNGNCISYALLWDFKVTCISTVFYGELLSHTCFVFWMLPCR